jgi:predicted Fe-Mo cluster-binding NifX family protein
VIIAIATDGGKVAEDLDGCRSYTLVGIENGQQISWQNAPNPGHSPQVLPDFLRDAGATLVITGGISPREQAFLEEHGIGTVLGVSGTVYDTVHSFLKGTLWSGKNKHDQERS